MGETFTPGKKKSPCPAVMGVSSSGRATSTRVDAQKGQQELRHWVISECHESFAQDFMCSSWCRAQRHWLGYRRAEGPLGSESVSPAVSTFPCRFPSLLFGFHFLLHVDPFFRIFLIFSSAPISSIFLELKNESSDSEVGKATHLLGVQHSGSVLRWSLPRD